MPGPGEKPRPPRGLSNFHFRVVPQRSGWSGGGDRRSLPPTGTEPRSGSGNNAWGGGMSVRPFGFAQDRLRGGATGPAVGSTGHALTFARTRQAINIVRYYIEKAG